MTNDTNTTSRRYRPWIAAFIAFSLLSFPFAWPLLVLFLVGSLIVWGIRRWRGNTESFIGMFKSAFSPKPKVGTPAVAPATPVAPVSTPSAVPLPDEIRLGTDFVNGRATGVYLDELQQHSLLLGATGSGKTTTLLKITDGAAALESAGFDYIETFYNRQRRHSTLGMLSPAAYERAQTESTKPIKIKERTT